MKRKAYEKQLKALHVEMTALQGWVKDTRARIIVVFEGRDAAGKGGVIKAMTQRVSPRVFRTVALPAPTEREQSQVYFQRYAPHWPAAGEVVLFDRSWYNRAGVEVVMGFCTPDERDRFLIECPRVERMLVDDGIVLIKYWMEVSPEKQLKRFSERIDDPRKHWKLSPIDLESRRRWYAYSRARDKMMDATDTEYAPWHVVPSDDKYAARLNCITHFLSQIDYQRPPREVPELADIDASQAYDDEAPMKKRRYVPAVF